jgi:hypothetical protein
MSHFDTAKANSLWDKELYAQVLTVLKYADLHEQLHCNFLELFFFQDNVV